MKNRCCFNKHKKLAFSVSQGTHDRLFSRKWLGPRTFIPQWSLIIWVKGIRRRTVCSDQRHVQSYAIS